MIRRYLFPFSLLIYKQKEVCMWKRTETTVLTEGVVEYSNYYWQYTYSFVFVLCISVLWLSKRHLWIPVKIEKKKADILWLSSVIPVEEVLLFFLLPYLIYWFIALGIYPFLGEALLNCIIENLRTLLMKISFENKCLGTWISNANAFFYHHKM